MRGEDGHVPLELALGSGLLVLPIAILALSFPTWVERRSMAHVAAQEAARAAVLAPDAGSAARGGAQLVAEIARNHDVPPTDVSVCWSVHEAGAPSPPSCSGLSELPRHAAVTAHVTVVLPALTFPGLDTQLGAVEHTVAHTERVDRYRSFP